MAGGGEEREARRDASGWVRECTATAARRTTTDRAAMPVAAQDVLLPAPTSSGGARSSGGSTTVCARWRVYLVRRDCWLYAGTRTRTRTGTHSTVRAVFRATTYRLYALTCPATCPMATSPSALRSSAAPRTSPSGRFSTGVAASRTDLPSAHPAPGPRNLPIPGPSPPPHPHTLPPSSPRHPPPTSPLPPTRLGQSKGQCTLLAILLVSAALSHPPCSSCLPPSPVCEHTGQSARPSQLSYLPVPALLSSYALQTSALPRCAPRTSLAASSSQLALPALAAAHAPPATKGKHPTRDVTRRAPSSRTLGLDSASSALALPVWTPISAGHSIWRLRTRTCCILGNLRARLLGLHGASHGGADASAKVGIGRRLE
ncbi:hypothetical protein OH76DRAFT_203170 [Lentinus brumalis]|uniref:Uncharacterized protein n=1 Tax=Lentinus brumalis TaxID=2498619 RepID=A0A371DIA4_9APHY|nr:hypothetical protein OH76DRAFT_203170 [Polyporus brumalis]